MAVFSGNIAASLTSHTRDHLYEQITPTKMSAGNFNLCVHVSVMFIVVLLCETCLSSRIVRKHSGKCGQVCTGWMELRWLCVHCYLGPTNAKIPQNLPLYVFDCRGNFYQILSLFTGTSFIIPALLFNGEIFPPKVKVITTQSNSLVSVPAHNHTVHVVESGGLVNVELTPRDFSLFIYSDKPVIVYIFMASAKVCIF